MLLLRFVNLLTFLYKFRGLQGQKHHDFHFLHSHWNIPNSITQPGDSIKQRSVIHQLNYCSSWPLKIYIQVFHHGRQLCVNYHQITVRYLISSFCWPSVVLSALYHVPHFFTKLATLGKTERASSNQSQTKSTFCGWLLSSFSVTYALTWQWHGMVMADPNPKPETQSKRTENKRDEKEKKGWGTRKNMEHWNQDLPSLVFASKQWWNQILQRKMLLNPELLLCFVKFVVLLLLFFCLNQSVRWNPSSFGTSSALQTSDNQYMYVFHLPQPSVKLFVESQMPNPDTPIPATMVILLLTSPLWYQGSPQLYDVTWFDTLHEEYLKWLKVMGKICATGTWQCHNSARVKKLFSFQ